MKTEILQVPYGTADILPGEAAARRKIIDCMAAVYQDWGYEEVQTPTFEYLSTFGGGGRVSDSNFKFFDRRNNILMLRTDMTAPIARLVATRMKAESGVKRLSYRSQIFRYEETQEGRQCEFSQSGVEMMGADAVAADAEIIALAATVLKQAGLLDFTISVGQVEFINGLTAAAGFSDQETQALKHCLITHNAVGLQELSQQKKLTGTLAKIVPNLLFLHGGPEILQKLASCLQEKRCLQALKRLQGMYDLAKVYGIASYLSFDLGLLRDFDYYTGMIFEGFTPGLGYSILGGGRYDKMMSGFGSACPAIGFAIGVDRVVLALVHSGHYQLPRQCDFLVAYGQDKLPEAIKTCMQLRAAGHSVKLAAAAVLQRAVPELQKAAHCEKHIYIG